MSTTLLHACLTCGRPSEGKYCAAHSTNGRRPNAWQRGYQAEFQRNRAKLLADNPTCTRCGKEPAVVAHHNPPRRTLLASGVENCDAFEWLRGMCDQCHRILTSQGK